MMILKPATRWFWLVILVAGTHGDDFKCDLSKKVDNGPSLPTILSDSDSYQAHVEVTVLDKNKTMAVDEYLDYEGNRALMVMYSKGVKTSVIFSYDTDEVFTLAETVDSGINCTVQNISESKYNFLFSSNQLPDYDDPDKKHIFGTNAALRFGAGGGASYMGTGEVRGVIANIWSACITWPDLKGSMQVTYYFSPPDWSVSSPLSPSLLRIETEGLSNLNTDGSKATQPRNFHHIYDFINFLPYLDEDPSIFLTPPGVVCKNRKNNRHLPQFRQEFSYRTEIIDPVNSQITHYAVQYNGGAKLARIDTHTSTPAEPDQTTDPTTSIYDFNYGIRYDLDNYGGCSINPVDPTGSFSQEEVSRFQFNSSLVIDMKTPEALFMFNENYTFTGQRFVRGMLCDVFSYQNPSFHIDGKDVSASFDYHFLADGWHDFPLNSLKSDVEDYPVQLVISAPKVAWTRVYNFFEFVNDIPPIEAYDISSCFTPSQKVTFRLTFPGEYDPNTEEEWTNNLHYTLADTMVIFPIRISNIRITYDNFNIYADAVLLDTLSAVQFQHQENQKLERTDVKIYKDIKTEGECASKCVHNPDYEWTCNGFQLCPYDGYACRLLQNHVATKPVLKNATACDEYSRTANGPALKEPSLVEAYGKLTQAVSEKQLSLQIRDSSGYTHDPYVAINIELKSGKPVKKKEMPPIANQGSLRMELIDPSTLSVVETFVWYDRDLGVSRYDTRDPTNDQPFQMTRIHDFNVGVSYEINQVTLECSVMPLSNDNVYDVKSDSISQNGSLIIHERTPLEVLFMDYPYEYLGQSTVRGIPCDVYEAMRPDYAYDVFKFYFQAPAYSYIAPIATDITRSQPVQLIMESQDRVEVTFNFFDFSDQYHTTNYFDTSACFGADEKKSFVVIFKDQPYHPTLDTTSATFVDLALTSLASQTYTSLIKFQGAAVSYDDDDVYLTVTALGKVNPINLFTPVKRVEPNLADETSYAQSPDDCAAACASEDDFPCNSFDWCPDENSPSCMVGAKHEESEGDVVMNVGRCLHFSRSENATFPTPSVERIYQIVTDYVYNGDFNITINVPDGPTKTYTATDIRDDILLPEDPASTSGSFLRKFAVSPKMKLTDDLIQVTHKMVSVTDCAVLCIQENTFRCEAFDYMFTIGTCRLSKLYPDEPMAPSPALARNDYYSTYTRLYSDEYKQFPGQVFKGSPDKSMSNVISMELCARACTDLSDFVCEAFELCSNSASCNLFKTHILQAKETDLSKSPDCLHYSRNHLFDYIKRTEQSIDGHALSVVEVQDVSKCAQMCSSEDLPSCASFQVCDQERGGMKCTFLTVNPAVSKDVTIKDSIDCTLYTQANPVPIVSPTVTQAAPTKTQTDPKTPKPSTATTPTPKDVNTPKTLVTDSTGKGKSCAAASTDDSSDTGPRVGIAFGTLFLGIAVGAVVAFFIMHFRQKRSNTEDAHMLKTWG